MSSKSKANTVSKSKKVTKKPEPKKVTKKPEPKKVTKKPEPKKVTKKPEPKKVTIGIPQLTRFERARIVSSRSLQLSLGAPPFIPLDPKIKDPITLAMAELEAKALPISIRRTLPSSRYEDIPVDWLS